MTERQITALERMSSAALKAEWERLTGTPAPRISPSMMRLALAFECRSRARGGYSRRLIDDRGSRPSAEVDPSVVRLLAQAHRWWRILRDEPPQWWWHRSRSPAWHVGRVHLHDIGASAREEHRQARHCDTLHWHRRGARAGCRACLTHRYGPDFAVRHCLSVNGSAESAIPCIERPPPRIQ